ncbi:SUSD5 protein, partial [Amia calva]|nr:SUSD5 protein [Amia calva]
LTCVCASAAGRVFILESENGSEELDEAAARGACDAHGARLATLDELKRAVTQCAFTACTRGWLAGPNIGTTVCNNLGNGQQRMKAVDVKIENATTASSHLDTFCIKDQGKPCGDPPSFPHTNLQGHTGFEMGDELLYMCAQGYVTPNGGNTFSLLCDSCGEWYGLVQACVKDETEAHIDYEDKFPEERHMSYGHPEEQGEEQQELTFRPHQDPDQDRRDAGREEQSVAEAEEGMSRPETIDEEGVEDSTGSDSQKPTTPTESPMSLLSQKHLFPSETLHVTEGLKETEVPAREEMDPVFSEGDNHVGVKTYGRLTEVGKTFDDREDFPIDVPARETQNDTKEVTKSSLDSIDESWLDGHPVTQEAAEDGNKVDSSSMETEDGKIPGVTDRPNDVEISHTDTAGSTPAPDFTQIPAGPTMQVDHAIKQIPMEIMPTSAPEDRSTTPTASWETTETLYPVVDHMPRPTDTNNITTSYQDSKESTTGSLDELERTVLYDEFIERNLTHDAGAKLQPTAETCVGDNCSQPSRGPMIAIIIVAICVLILAATLAIWCYKKKQQKSSVYKMNGKGQTRHPQQIEMQQKV